MSCDVSPIFVEKMTRPGVVSGLDLIFNDADRQIRGWLRLAGGEYRQELNRLADSEDRHAYHRLYWATRLARAAAFGHHDAGRRLTLSLRRWLNQSDGFESLAYAAYTAAERIASLTEVLFWIGYERQASLENLVVPIKQQIWGDAQRLSQKIEYGLGVHNHLLNNARGLYLAGVALAGSPETQGWERQAFGIWENYFPALVLDDGTFAEQSSHYHLLLCRTALEYVLAARKSRRELPEGFEFKIRGMFRLANDLLRPDGSMPRFGDNSPDCVIEDLWGLLTAAHHHKLLDEAPRHAAVTPLTLYYCEQAPELAARAASNSARLYPSGGFAFLRSSDGSAEVAVHADPRAEARAHGDPGRGSFELWRNGQVIIREPGCFLSPSTNRGRWYRTAEAQNVTCIEGLPPTLAGEHRAQLPAWYGSEGGTWHALPDSTVRFDCEAFQRLRPDLGLSRLWRWNLDGCLHFEEDLTGTGSVRFTSRLCLGDGKWGQLQWDRADGSGRLSWNGAGQGALLEFQTPRGISAKVEAGSFVPEYGVEKPAQVIVLQGTQELPFQWTLRCRFRTN